MDNIINLVQIFVVFLSITLFWVQIFSITSEEAMCFTAIFIMAGTLSSGIAGYVKYIYYVSYFFATLGILCFVLNISLKEKKKENIIKRFVSFFNPSVFIFGLVFVYTIIAFKGVIYTYPDELSQWGVAVKYMHETGKLPYGAAFLGVETNFSMATMFQFFWTGLGKFHEKNTLIGNYLLAIIPVFLSFSGVRWKDFKKVFGYSIAVFLAMNVMSYVKYYTLLQDYVLPLWTGGVISWLMFGKKKKINWYLLMGCLMCIGAMKSMVGPMFALMVGMVVLVRQTITYNPKRLRECVNIKNILLTCGLFISIFSINHVWMKIIGSDTSSKYSNVYYAPEKELFQIITGMVNRIFDMASNSIKTFPNISFFVFWIAVIVFLVIMKDQFSDVKDKKLFSIVLLLYGCGFGVYLLVMLFAYLYVFGAADAVSVAGLERYLSYYMLTGCVPIVSLLFKNEKMINNKYQKYIPIILILVLSFGTGEKFVNKATAFYLPQEEMATTNEDEKKETMYQIRSDIKEEKNIIEKLSGTEGKIFILGTLRLDKAKIISYEFGDRYIWHENSYRIYTRYRSDVTRYQDIIRYPELFDIYDHEYIWCKGVEDDEERYLRMCYRLNMREIKEGAFYKLVRSEDGLTTEYLGNIEDILEDEKQGNPS